MALSLCKLCGGAAGHFMTRRDVPIVKCEICGFMFADLTEIYYPESIYDEAFWGDYDEYWRNEKRFYLRRLLLIRRLCKAGALLEIGCAAGYFLRAASEDGWQVAGVEVSEPMRERCARNVDCPLYDSVGRAVATGERFDCVAMFEVIEHLSDPPTMLGKVRGLMKPHALLAISTPNFECVEALGDPNFFNPPVHISYFSPQTLRACVEKAGFETLVLKGLLTRVEPPLPSLLASALRPFRRGKRLRPHGAVGKLIRKIQYRYAGGSYWRGMELYARRTD